jgi:hypothetical protein
MKKKCFFFFPYSNLSLTASTRERAALARPQMINIHEGERKGERLARGGRRMMKKQ